MDDLKILKAIEGLAHVRAREDLAEWVEEYFVAAYQPSSILIAVCKKYPKFRLIPQYVSQSFPQNLLKVFEMSDTALEVPLLQGWNQRESPSIKTMAVSDVDNSLLWKVLFQQKNFQTATVAVSCDLQKQQFSYYCFTDPVVEDASREAFHRAITVISPVLGNVLHQLHKKSTQVQLQESMSVLTPKELEILKWIQLGKTNYEISKITGSAVPTVKNHVQKILIKLQVSNRGEATYKLTSTHL